MFPLTVVLKGSFKFRFVSVQIDLRFSFYISISQTILFIDVQIFLDANFDLTLLGSQFTNDQIFRIAIVPAEFGTADLTMRDLLSGLQMNTIDVQKID